jgi:tRNA 2-thiouridine synthesizing protein A
MLHLDLTDLNCPLPVLKTQKFLSTLNSKEIVEVITTDPTSAHDLREFCQKTGNLLVDQVVTGENIKTIIQRR